MPETSQYDSGEKLRWEIEKLRAETDHLRRPWLRNPASWVAVITALVALTGVAVQTINSNRRADLAEIKREKTELEILKTEEVRKQTEESLSQVQAKRAKAEKELAALQRQIDILKAQVPSTPETREAFARADASLEALRVADAEFASRAEEAVGNLQAIGESIGERAPSSLPAFAVVASFTRLSKAQVFAREILAQDTTYPIEIYQREPGRFAVTLGGYLPYSEATRRVNYAREKGLSADAYVRFAKSWGKPVTRLPESPAPPASGTREDG